MVRRPKYLEYFSWFLIAVAASFPLQIITLYGHSPLEVVAIFSKLTFFNWLVMASMVGTAYATLRASPWLKVLIPLTIVVVAVNNWIVGLMNIDYSPLAAGLGTVGFISAHFVLCRESALELITHPERRWWLRAPRHRLEVMTYVSPLNGLAFKAKTFDISENGAFIKFDEETRYAVAEANARAAKQRFKKIEVDDRLIICFTLNNVTQIRCDAKVVRQAKARGIYPGGLGLSFEGISRNQKKELRRYLSHHSIVATAA